MIKLKLIRDTFTDNTTIGKLYVNGEYFCETLEDKDRGLHQDLSVEENTRLKVYGETCIPYGKYKVIVTPSVRLKRTLPLLVNVEGFQGIRIHKGNNKQATLGCICVGKTRGVDWIGQTTITEEKLVNLLKDKTEISIEIVKV